MTGAKSVLGNLIKSVIVLVMILCLLLVFKQYCRLENVSVSGTEFYSEDGIIDKVICKWSDNYAVLLYLRYKYTKTDKIPFVEYVDVELVDRNSVKLTVYEKRITGCVEAMGEYMYFDREGIVSESTTKRYENIPLITGLSFDRFVLNEPLNVDNTELFGTILNIVLLIENYEIPVDSIDFNRQNEVTLYIGDIIVLLGNHEQYDEPLSVLEYVLKSTDGMKATIDMKTYSSKNTQIIINKNE